MSSSASFNRIQFVASLAATTIFCLSTCSAVWASKDTAAPEQVSQADTKKPQAGKAESAKNKRSDSRASTKDTSTKGTSTKDASTKDTSKKDTGGKESSANERSAKDISSKATSAKAGSAAKGSSAAKNEDILALFQKSMYNGDRTLYIGHNHMKEVLQLEDRSIIWQAPKWDVQPLAPKRKLYSPPVTGPAYGKKVSVALTTLGIEPHLEQWKFERNTSFQSHPMDQYNYEDSDGLKGKAAYATDIPIPKAMGEYFATIYRIPNIGKQPLFVWYIDGHETQVWLKTTWIAKKSVPGDFFEIPKDYQSTTMGQMPVNDSKAAQGQIFSEVLGVRGYREMNRVRRNK